MVLVGNDGVGIIIIVIMIVGIVEIEIFCKIFVNFIF